MRDLLYEAESEAATKALARRLALQIEPDDVLALYGELGAGKTLFCSALKEALGAEGPMQSPTFTMLRAYEAGPGGRGFNHFDAYRLSSADDWYQLGFDEYLDEGKISAIEWADRVEAALPPRTIRLSFEKTGETRRTIHVRFPEVRRADLSL
jgi:tRNA threonylcarbamoyladenosine biosynthesis protein TsaE